MSTFTPAQQAAIAARGNVLVVAGAGTGKTRTLIARVLQRLREGASLDQFLLVTFTEAAAAEMRVRLRAALEAELPAIHAGDLQSPPIALEPIPAPHFPSPISHPLSPSDHLAEQLALLDAAPISTLHSFCLGLVREHFHHLAIDPQLVILDERQTRPLARDTLTALLAEHYAGRHPHSPAVHQLIRRAGRGSDEPLRALVWKLHCYAQSLPDPDAWFAAQLAAFRAPAPTQWENWLHEALADWRAEWLPAFANIPDVPALKRTAAALAGARTPASAAAALAEILAADATENWKRKKGELRKPFEKLFDEAAFFHGLLAPVALAEDWEWSRHAMAALVELARQFAARFAEAKRQLGGVDFADLEQFALRLLRDDSTGVARACQARFAHVCVDEYQDINAAQDAILQLVSRAGPDANRFLVGDLKQSIYRFRLADPRIFAAYSKAWRVAATPPSPAHVLALSENFRSRAAVLDFVNPLFRTLMREAVGGVAYDAEAELKFGNPDGRALLSRRPEAAGTTEQPLRIASTARVELHLLTTATEEADDDESTAERTAAPAVLDLLAVEREARCVALRLRALRAAGHLVWDDALKAERPVEWRDMVVLMRSPGSRVEAFAQEFHRAGVPLHAARGGFYDALEVSDLLNLLRLLDNPLQDLPLLAVLRSPLVAMSLEELVALRAHNDERLLWDALTKFCAARAGDSTSPALAEPLVAPNASSPSPPSGERAGVRGQTPLAPTHAPFTPHALLPHPQSLSAGGGEGGSLPASAAHRDALAPHSAFRIPRSAFEKASAFLARFGAWRERLRLSSLTDCLERVLAETHYEALLLAEPRGPERAANVRRLLDLARQFDPYQRQGLHRFLQFIAAQAEANLDHEPAPPATADAVRLMSIHQSKGLEFPVVVVAGLGTRFNEQDLRGDILLDEAFGLCPMISPPGSERKYASLPHWLAARRGRRELLGEELRLLYVAFTRARDTLLLTGTDAGKDVVAKWRAPAEPLTDATLLKARCPLNWLRAWLPAVTREADWRTDASGEGDLFRWDFYTADDARLARDGDTPVPEQFLQSGSECAEAPAELDALSPTGTMPSEFGADSRGTGASPSLALLDWTYPHADATHEPAKTSVTVLRRRAAEAEDDAATPWFRPRAVARRSPGELTAAQRGVAHHTFLQCVDLRCDATALSLRNEAARLVEDGLLTERDAAALDFAALLAFWESSVGQLVRANAARVQREVPFTARFTVAELKQMGLLRPADTSTPLHTTPEEFLIVQGVADLVVFRDEEIWLLDYKTDALAEAEVAAKTRDYGPQLTLYALALERIHQKRVTRTWLHFLALGRTELV